MKFLFFFSGLLLFVGGVVTAVSGALNDWDASIAAGPMAIGCVLMFVSVVFSGMEFEEKSKQR